MKGAPAVLWNVHKVIQETDPNGNITESYRDIFDRPAALNDVIVKKCFSNKNKANLFLSFKLYLKNGTTFAANVKYNENNLPLEFISTENRIKILFVYNAAGLLQSYKIVDMQNREIDHLPGIITRGNFSYDAYENSCTIDFRKNGKKDYVLINAINKKKFGTVYGVKEIRGKNQDLVCRIIDGWFDGSSYLSLKFDEYKRIKKVTFLNWDEKNQLSRQGYAVKKIQYIYPYKRIVSFYGADEITPVLSQKHKYHTAHITTHPTVNGEIHTAISYNNVKGDPCEDINGISSVDIYYSGKTPRIIKTVVKKKSIEIHFDSRGQIAKTVINGKKVANNQAAQYCSMIENSLYLLGIPEEYDSQLQLFFLNPLYVKLFQSPFRM